MSHPYYQKNLNQVRDVLLGLRKPTLMCKRYLPVSELHDIAIISEYDLPISDLEVRRV